MIENIYNNILFPWLFVGLITFFILLKRTAPYGKFSNKNWGFMISYKFGWFIQEIISPITFSYFFLTGDISNKSIAWIFFLIWNLHYLYRSIFFPLRKKGDSTCPILIVFSAIFFNLINGFTNGYYLGNLVHFNTEYILNYNFILGFAILIIGIIINFKSDNILLKIKNEGNGYQIPKHFLFKYISCPNYFGEIIEWSGFAIMTCSFPALLFALWTMFNLIPRAISTHKWYKKEFESYPKSRKAVIPFIV